MPIKVIDIAITIFEEPSKKCGEPNEQCSHKISRDRWDLWTTRYRDEVSARLAHRGWSKDQCFRGAKIKLNGVLYCKQHAGRILVEKL